jgi:hypothetical protein
MLSDEIAAYIVDMGSERSVLFTDDRSRHLDNTLEPHWYKQKTGYGFLKEIGKAEPLAPEAAKKGDQVSVFVDEVCVSKPYAIVETRILDRATCVNVVKTYRERQEAYLEVFNQVYAGYEEAARRMVKEELRGRRPPSEEREKLVKKKMEELANNDPQVILVGGKPALEEMILRYAG